MEEIEKFEPVREVDLRAWGYDKPAQVKRLSYGEMKAMRHALDLIKAENAEDADDKAVYTILGFCLVDAPGGISQSAQDQLDWEALAYIATKAQEHNGPLVMRPDSASSTPTSTEHATVTSPKC